MSSALRLVWAALGLLRLLDVRVLFARLHSVEITSSTLEVFTDVVRYFSGKHGDPPPHANQKTGDNPSICHRTLKECYSASALKFMPAKS